MHRQLLRWCCILGVVLALVCAPSVSAATFFVGPKRLGVFPNQFFVWNPTNVVINVGDTVMWTNLGSIHSLKPTPTNSPEQFCGTGTNEIANCTVTFSTSGTFRYDCFQHIATMTGSVIVLGPTAVITNPPNNAIFAAPATVTVSADATNGGGGNVIDVRFLSNGVSIATSTVAPYRVTLSNLAVGSYTLRARATDSSQIVATSPPVTLRVAPPPLIAASRGANGPLQFSFNTVTGVNYVVEGSLVVTNFSPIVTNIGSGGAQQFFQNNPAPTQRFFRVRLQ